MIAKSRPSGLDKQGGEACVLGLESHNSIDEFEFAQVALNVSIARAIVLR